jgi:hypothetical protein
MLNGRISRSDDARKNLEKVLISFMPPVPELPQLRALVQRPFRLWI